MMRLVFSYPYKLVKKCIGLRFAVNQLLLHDFYNENGIMMIIIPAKNHVEFPTRDA